MSLSGWSGALHRGPWVAWNVEDGGLGGDSFIGAPGDADPDIYVQVRVAGEWHSASKADQDFIAAARNSVSELIVEIRKLRASTEG